jgi:hypothetical protein
VSTPWLSFVPILVGQSFETGTTIPIGTGG